MGFTAYCNLGNRAEVMILKGKMADSIVSSRRQNSAKFQSYVQVKTNALQAHKLSTAYTQKRQNISLLFGGNLTRDFSAKRI